MAYETATEIIASALAMCGLSSVVDPYASSDDTQVQIRALLNQCGRELYASFQWEQFVKTHTFNTGSPAPADGIFALPSDFGYLINQTGWTPYGNNGLGLPLGGPLTEQQYAYLVSTNLSNSTIYVSFRIANGTIAVLPAPPPDNLDVSFQYMSNGWVYEAGAPTNRSTKADEADDVIMFEPILISTMLATRFKQAKGLDAKANLEQFQNMYILFTGVNAAAPIISLASYNRFPYLNSWTNVPQTGFGS